MTTVEYPGGELALFASARRWKAYVSAQVGPLLSGDVLEVGAGIGETALTLWNDEIRTWTAIEPDPDLFEQAKRVLDESHITGCRVIQGIVGDLPAEPAYDVAIYIDVLEHIELDRQELESVAKRVRPGGLVVVLAPAHQWLFSPFDRSVGHYRRYNSAMFEALDNVGGLRLQRSWYLDSVGLLASMANRLLLRSGMPSPKQIATWDGLLVRASKVTDRMVFHRLGKTIVGVWQKP